MKATAKHPPSNARKKTTFWREGGFCANRFIQMRKRKGIGHRGVQTESSANLTLPI